MKDLVSNPGAAGAPTSAPLPCETLKDVRRWVEDQPASTRRRDSLSAFGFLSTTAGLDLASIPARPRDLRALFANLSAPRLRVSPKRLANVRSLVNTARDGAQAAAGPRAPKPRIGPEWLTLLEIVPWDQYRWGLAQMARYCTHHGIAPDAVGSDTLIGLRTHLDQESVIKDPKGILKHTIALWNRCQREVEGWPDIRLSSPTKPEAYMLPLDAFPESFAKDIAAWTARMQAPDPFDPRTPVRAMRPSTVRGYIFTIRKVASALVRGGHLAAEEVAGLDVLVAPRNFKEGLRPFAKKNRARDRAQDGGAATQHGPPSPAGSQRRASRRD